MNVSANDTPAGSAGGGSSQNLDCATFDQSTYVQNPYLTSSAFMLGLSVVTMNLLVIMFMGWSLSKAKGQNIPKLLVVILAVVDCSFGSISILTQAFRYMWGHCGIGGNPVCVTQACLANVINVMSSLFVVLMSAERFCALRMPFRYDLIFTLRNTMLILGAMLTYSFLVAALPLMGLNSYSFGNFGCDFNWSDKSPGGLFYNYFRGFQGLVLMPVMFSLDINTMREINRMTSVAPSAPASGGSDGKKGGGDDASVAIQKRFTVLTLCASTAFVICNTPILIRLIQYQTGVKNPPVQDYFIKRMHISNSLINPCLSLFFYLSNIKWANICPCLKSNA